MQDRGGGGGADQTGSVTRIQQAVLSIYTDPDPRELAFTSHTHTHTRDLCLLVTSGARR